MAVHLPMSRVRTIMKSSADVDIVSKESIFVVTRAAEFFIKTLSSEAHNDSKKGKKLEYHHVANIVSSNNRYDFLNEIIPQKITVAEYFKIMKEKNVDIERVLHKSSSSDSSSESEYSQGDEDDRKDSDIEFVENFESPDLIECIGSSTTNSPNSEADVILIE